MCGSKIHELGRIPYRRRCSKRTRPKRGCSEGSIKILWRWRLIMKICFMVANKSHMAKFPIDLTLWFWIIERINRFRWPIANKRISLRFT